MSTDADTEESVATPAASQPAGPPTPGAPSRSSALRRFFWRDEKIASAKARCLGPLQPAWAEYQLAKDVRDAIEGIRDSGHNCYSLLLLRRTQLLLLIRCHLLRSGLTVGDRSLGISDFSTVRKIPAVDTLLQNLPASHCAHVEALLGEHSEFYLVGLDQKQREALEAALVETATTLMASLEREAGVVRRLKIGRWVRIGAAAALVFMAVYVKFGGFADHSGKANLALFRTVIVSSHIGGVDHLLVDGDRANMGFHTEGITNQFVIIDLAGSLNFDKVVVYNRADCCKERAVPLELSVSEDGENYLKLAERNTPFDVWTASRLRAKGRFVRLRLLSDNFFHLSEVEIY